MAVDAGSRSCEPGTRRCMRKATLAILCAVVAGLLLLPGGASASTTMVVQDTLGDVGVSLDARTGTIRDTLSPHAPLVKAGYFDIASAWLIQKGGNYVFGMEMAVALPEEGTPLPNQVKLAEWIVWIDAVPFIVDPTLPPVGFVTLRYDGSSYSAFAFDYAAMTERAVPFSVEGSKMQLEFAASWIGAASISWWLPAAQVWVGPLGTGGVMFVDLINPGAAPGQVGMDLPWPPV